MFLREYTGAPGVLTDLIGIPSEGKWLSVQDVIEAAALVSRMTITDYLSCNSRMRGATHKPTAMAVAVVLTRQPLQLIARKFRRDHSCVVKGWSNLERRVKAGDTNDIANVAEIARVAKMRRVSRPAGVDDEPARGVRWATGASVVSNSVALPVLRPDQISEGRRLASGAMRWSSFALARRYGLTEPQARFVFNVGI
jgi:hypothetical protein